MVLETIMKVRENLGSPWHMLFYGAVISLISLVVAYLVPSIGTGMMAVVLITIISAPFMLKLFDYGEAREERKMRSLGLIGRLNPVGAFLRQGKIFLIYGAFLLGVMASLTAAFLVLPASFASDVFSDQIDQIDKILAVIGSATNFGSFDNILLNNLTVMVMVFVFALLFGVGGSIFLLAWNASVVSAAVGLIANANGVFSAIATIVPHGVVELSAYIIAAIAGGIVSAAVSKNGAKNLGRVVADMSLLLVLSTVLVVVAGSIESL